MSNKLLKHTQAKLGKLLSNVGDMALKRRARRVIEELNLQKGDKIIDVGCGNGYYLYLLAHLPVDTSLLGIDDEEAAVRDAKIYAGSKKPKLMVGDIYKLPFPREAFNKAVMSEVVEHLNDEKKALNEVFRILKPGGILALTTTNQEFPFLWDPINWVLQHLFKTHIKSGFWAGIWNQHTKLYKPEEIRRVIEGVGFKIEKIEFLTFWCLPFNHYLLNLAARLVYDKHLPQTISDAILKFKNKRKPPWIAAIYYFVNFFDRLNDIFPKNSGVSIFVKARK